MNASRSSGQLSRSPWLRAQQIDQLSAFCPNHLRLTPFFHHGNCTLFRTCAKSRPQPRARKTLRTTWSKLRHHNGGLLRKITFGLFLKFLLRCPETLFISHEHANFLFSVFRVVQGEAKTPKIMGCCRAFFAFLHALKIGTFRGKWTLEWVLKTSQFFRLALYFLINSKLAFSLHVSERCLTGTAKKNLI